MKNVLLLETIPTSVSLTVGDIKLEFKPLVARNSTNQQLLNALLPELVDFISERVLESIMDGGGGGVGFHWWRRRDGGLAN